MTLVKRFHAFSPGIMRSTALLLVILAAAFAATVAACDANHYDMYLGTDAGAGFDAPARETETDGGGGSDAGDASGTGDDAGDDGDGGPPL